MPPLAFRAVEDSMTSGVPQGAIGGSSSNSAKSSANEASSSNAAGSSRPRPPAMTMDVDMSNANSNDQRLPAMALSDMPSPFALPSQRSFFGLGNGPGQVDPNGGQDPGREGPAAGTSANAQRYAYRQPAPATPSTPDAAASASGAFPGGLGQSGSPSPRLAARLGSISPRAGANGSHSPFALPSASASTSSFGEALGGPMPAKSPWHHLAAMSGEPTPAIDGKSNMFEFGFARSARASISSVSGDDGGAQSHSGTASPSAAGAGATPTRRGPFPPVPRGQSPQIGTPFERLDLNGANAMAQTPSAAGAGMADPFAMAFPLRRGSASGPSSLNPNRSAGSSAAGPSRLAPPPASNAGSIASAPAGGMKLKLPAALAARRTSQPGLTMPGQGKAVPSRFTQNADLQITPQAMPIDQLESKIAKASGPDTATPSRPLILDLRPPSAFSSGRIPGSLSLPIPSTLLKRRTFTLAKLIEMLPPRASRLLGDFATHQDVVLVDQDSTVAPTGGVMAGLASKLASAAPSEWKGTISFLKGGVSACGDMELSEGSSEEEDVNMDRDDEIPADIDMDNGESGSAKGSGSGGMQSPASGSGLGSGSAGSSASGNAGVLPGSGRMIGGLGKLAFQQASTKGTSQRKLNTLRLPSYASNSESSQAGDAAMYPNAAVGSESRAPSGSVGTSSRSGSSKSKAVSDVKRLQPANPFFDNIRQNLELSHGGITERIPLNLPEEIIRRSQELPPFLRALVEKPADQGANQLASEFEAVERGEQRRLQGIMNWHSRGSRKLSGWQDQDEEDREDEIMVSANAGLEQQAINRARAARRKSGSNQFEGNPASGEEYFPFSITAGIERGSKNRYKNIWPYDFSRVRLHEKCFDDGSDYINANFIQPRGTSRRYIATQGPMDATFRDFWTLVWEQNVHVIVMLTKQFEGGAVKCGDYWTEGEYGPFRLQLLSSEGGEDVQEKAVSGFNFFTPSDKPAADSPTIRRTFMLTKKDDPDAKPHKIMQMQCVSWPDFDVPSSPQTLLHLIKEVDEAVATCVGEDSQSKRPPPVLVHCSAGVGRTGSFIVVDAMLDALRREHLMKKRRVKPAHHRSSDNSRGKNGSISAHPSAGNLRSAAFGADDGSALLSRSPGTTAERQSFLSPPPSGHAVEPAPTSEVADDRPATPGEMAAFRNHMESMDHSEADYDEDDALMKRRPSAAESDDSDSGSDKVTHTEQFHFEMGRMPRPDASSQEHTPSPIMDIQEPVKTVLEGMRVQRMSLCQSLRQYVFVYRSVIQGYLMMLDEENRAAEEAQAQAGHNGSSGPSNGHADAGGSSPSPPTAALDDDGHIKRRASPTELSGAGLTKRASFRKGSRGGRAGEGAVTPLLEEGKGGGAM